MKRQAKECKILIESSKSSDEDLQDAGGKSVNV